MDERITALERQSAEMRDQLDDHVSLLMTLTLLALRRQGFKVGPLQKAWLAHRESPDDQAALLELKRAADEFAQEMDARTPPG